jgi:hypothetical protein
MLNMQTMCSSISAGKQQRAYRSIWAGVVSFVLVLVHVSHRGCFLCNEVMRTEEIPPPRHRLLEPPVHYTSGIFNAKIHHEEVGDFWHLHHQGMSFASAFKWRIFENPPLLMGSRWLWTKSRHLEPPPPTSGNSSFLPHSPELIDIWRVQMGCADSGPESHKGR